MSTEIWLNDQSESRIRRTTVGSNSNLVYPVQDTIDGTEFAVIKATASSSPVLVPVSALGVASNADTTPPAVQSLLPANNAVNVPVTTNTVLTFTEPVVGVSNKTITYSSPGKPTLSVAASDNSQVTIAGAVVTINLTTDFALDSVYTLVIPEGAFSDAAGNPSPALTRTFTTSAAVAPNEGGTVDQKTYRSVYMPTIDDYFEYNNADAWALPAGDFTIAAFMRLQRKPNQAEYHKPVVIWAGNTSTQFAYSLTFDRLGELQFVYRNTVPQIITSTARLDFDDSWYIIAARRTGDTIELVGNKVGETVSTLYSQLLTNTEAITPNDTTQQLMASSVKGASDDFGGRNNLSWIFKIDQYLTNTQLQTLLDNGDVIDDLGLTPSIYTVASPAGTLAQLGSTPVTVTQGGAPEFMGSAEFVDTPVTINQPKPVVPFNSPSDRNATMTFSGTYIGNPNRIQLRIVNPTGGQVVGWKNATYPSAGTWEVTLDVPEGGEYVAVARHSNNTALNVACVDKFSVGFNVGYLGQSNAEYNLNNNSGTVVGYPDKTLLYYNGAMIDPRTVRSSDDINAGGAVKLANELTIISNNMKTISDAALGGSPLTNVQTNAWDGRYDEATGTYQLEFLAPTLVAGTPSLFLWLHGESDALRGVNRSDWSAAAARLLARIRTDLGKTAAELPIFLVIMGDTSDESGTWGEIRLAQMDVLDTAGLNVLPCSVAFDLTRSDAYHYEAVDDGDDGYTEMAKRQASAIAHWYDPVTYPNSTKGATAISAVRNGTSVDITYTLNNGTTLRGLTSASDLTGFYLEKPALPVVSMSYDGAGTCTVVTSAAHGMTTGDKATFLGAIDYRFNVVAATVTVISATSLTFSMQGGTNTSTAAGTLEYRQVVPITSTSIPTPTMVKLTTAETVTAGWRVHYAYANDFDGTNSLYTDAPILNSSRGTPAYPIEPIVLT